MIAPTLASTSQYAQRMRHAFAGLTTIQQQALYLTAVEHMPPSVVARRLDLDVEVAEQIACAARTKVYTAVAA
ncbi:MAG: hypothetical protein ABW156_11820 [Jiangellaceae bacterium]